MEYHESFDNYFIGGKKYYDCTNFYFYLYFLTKKPLRFHMVYVIFYPIFFIKLNIDTPSEKDGVYFCSQIIFFKNSEFFLI